MFVPNCLPSITFPITSISPSYESDEPDQKTFLLNDNNLHASGIIMTLWLNNSNPTYVESIFQTRTFVYFYPYFFIIFVVHFIVLLRVCW